MGQTFHPYEPDQSLLFPPSLDDWLPEDHLARFVSDTVDELDLKPLYEKYESREDGRGQLAYHPRMMLKVLFYSYCEGIFSSRKIAKGIEGLVALRFLAAGSQPSHRTIARFRLENLVHFERLFVEVVRIATRAGLVKMGTLAIDGSKFKANASKHKAMSYGRMAEEEKRLRKEIRRITKLAKGIDEAEDGEFGPDFRGDELPEELRRRKDRLQAIREAKQRLEEEQAAEDEAQERGKRREETGRGPKLKRPNGVPEDKKQANFTDPESRIMGDPKTGFVQGYNAQIAVDGEERIVVAADVTQCAADSGQLVPMTKSAVENTEKDAKHLVADAGYKSEANFQAVEGMGIEAHVALGRGERDAAKATKAGPATERMQRRRKTKKSQAIYKKRKGIVEPAFGWIKAAMGFRSFSMRGLEKVTAEWNLVCLTLNLKRMAGRLEWTT
jgi:transposase/IS5 family transposase